MKLLVATPLYPPDSGGPATYAKLLAEHLPEVPSHAGEGEGSEVILVKFGDVKHLPSGIRHIVYFWHVLKASRHADIVLALDPVSTGLPALFAAGILRKPFVVKIVGDFAWEQGRQRFGIASALDEFVLQKKVPFPVALMRKVQTFVASHSTKIIVPSNYLKGIVATWNISEDTIVVINNAIVSESKTELPQPVQKLPRPRIVSAGRLVPWKGFDDVIKAVVEIRKEIPDVSLVIIGDGPDRAMLESRAVHTLRDNFLFTGLLPHAEALSVIADADVFVLNSTYEGMSHILIEALVCGAPIVATDAGGNKEVIQDTEDGLLVPSGDLKALTETLTRVLKDPELRARLGAHALESSKRFSVPVMITTTHELLSSLVTHRASVDTTSL